MSLKIVPLPSGYTRGVKGSGVTFQRNHDKDFDLQMMFFAVLGGEHPVLVDSGTPSVEYVREHHGYHSFERSEEEEPLLVLERAGIDPAEIGTVIFTHLHWDHCSNSELFPNARFIVQQAELHYAIDPLPIYRKAYQRTATVNPSWLDALPQFETVRGEVEVLPGITVIPLPGHSPGSQGVLVETASGRYLLAGDCIDRYENWEGDATQAHLPSASFTNLHDFYDSFARIEALECEVIPGHDPRVLARGIFE